MPETHLTDTEIAAFVDGSDSTRSLAEMQDHLADCDSCRRLTVESSALVASLPRRTHRTWMWTAGAAAIAAGLLISIVPLSRFRSGEAVSDAVTVSERSPQLDRGQSIRATSPSETAPVTGDAVTFAWAGQAGNSYRLIVTDSTGGPVWSTVTQDTIVTLRTRREPLSPGRYYWYVDALRSDGLTGTSGRNTFTIARE